MIATLAALTGRPGHRRSTAAAASPSRWPSRASTRPRASAARCASTPVRSTRSSAPPSGCTRCCPRCCTGCELCLPPCPVDCIAMIPAGRAWSPADAARRARPLRSRATRGSRSATAKRAPRPDAGAPQRVRDATPDAAPQAVAAALARARAARAALGAKPMNPQKRRAIFERLRAANPHPRSGTRATARRSSCWSPSCCRRRRPTRA